MLQSDPKLQNATATIRARLQTRQSTHQPLAKSSTPTPPTEILPTQAIGQRDRQATLQQLAGEVRQLESAAGRHDAALPTISAGCDALDACLPSGGYAAGSVIEYLRSTAGCGASYLALVAAANALRLRDGFLVIVDPHHEIFPPAILSLGIPLDKTIFVRPQSQADLTWAIDQALRTAAVTAVVADVEVLDDRAARRLQLAAEHGQGLGLLLRSLAARRGPSWSDVQWVVRGTLNTDGNRQISLRLARVRGGMGGQVGKQVQVEINATTGALQSTINRGGHEQQRTSHNQPQSKPTRSKPTQSNQSSTLRLAAELASTASASRRARTG
ncbi:MAG: hypothetical protein R3C53_07275 [Pirellulaceae bacterium]